MWLILEPRRGVSERDCVPCRQTTHDQPSQIFGKVLPLLLFAMSESAVPQPLNMSDEILSQN